MLKSPCLVIQVDIRACWPIQEIREIPTVLAAHTIGTDVAAFPDKLEGFLQLGKLTGS